MVVLPIDLRIWWTCSAPYGLLVCTSMAGAFFLVYAIRGILILQLEYPDLIVFDPVYCMPASIIGGRHHKKYFRESNRM